jgi:hypothetical protein
MTSIVCNLIPCSMCEYVFHDRQWKRNAWKTAKGKKRAHEDSDEEGTAAVAKTVKKVKTVSSVLLKSVSGK